MRTNYMMTADEVAAELGISKGHAYKMIRQMNEELEKAGFIGKRSFSDIRRQRKEGWICQHIRMKSKIPGTVCFITEIGRETRRKSKKGGSEQRKRLLSGKTTIS